MSTHTILIVDDETAIREMVRMTLEMAGFHCLEAEDAIQAHGLVIDENPDLILLGLDDA